MSDLFDDKRIAPMLLYETTPFDSEDCIYELKLDGIRCLAYIDKTSVVLQNKRFKDVSEIYPELSNMCKCVSKRCILDGEIICLKNGKPNFYGVQSRSLISDKLRIQLSSKSNPAYFVAFDILYLGKKDITQLPLTERKKLLSLNVKEGNNLSISRYIDTNGIAFFNLAKEQGLEGIVAKRKDGLYHIGKRTRDWLKIKVMQDEDLIVCGFSTAENKIKDLVLGYYDQEHKLKCRGKVYLGVSDLDKRAIEKYAENHTVGKPWFDKYKDITWLRPTLVGTAHFMHQTPSGSMRQPVWKGLREDKSAEDCVIKSDF